MRKPYGGQRTTGFSPDSLLSALVFYCFSSPADLPNTARKTQNGRDVCAQLLLSCRRGEPAIGFYYFVSGTSNSRPLNDRHRQTDPLMRCNGPLKPPHMCVSRHWGVECRLAGAEHLSRLEQREHSADLAPNVSDRRSAYPDS